MSIETALSAVMTWLGSGLEAVVLQAGPPRTPSVDPVTLADGLVAVVGLLLGGLALLGARRNTSRTMLAFGLGVLTLTTGRVVALHATWLLGASPSLVLFSGALAGFAGTALIAYALTVA